MLDVLNKKTNLPLITSILRGIEKESLRVTSDGQLAQTPHSPALGSALSHPQITTDFSEVLLEFITAPSHHLAQVLSQLQLQHHFTAQQLPDEMMWVSSMPCSLPYHDAIPIAQYGSSNVGRMKTIYRLGLSHRYGRAMQAISGIHYNFSLPDALWALLQQQENNYLDLQHYKTQRYFGLIRNFRRHLWLLLYLFGASPALCKNFVNQQKPLLNRAGDTLFAPYSTSLRMGDLGYQSNEQRELQIHYNDLSSYLNTLTQAIKTPYADYQQLPFKNADGDYQQLNTSLLQIENEFYSTIRPKRTAQSGETALSALCNRGVEYIEVRCIDLNPFTALGIDSEQIHFLDTFLLHCLLQHSPKTDNDEHQRIESNQTASVYYGRDENLKLQFSASRTRSIKDWGKELLHDMQPVAELLDHAYQHQGHQHALAKQLEKIDNSSLTPSAQMLQLMQAQKLDFQELGLMLTRQHHKKFIETPLPTESLALYQQLASESLLQQKHIEAQDTPNFDQYLQEFYAQYTQCSQD